MDDVGAEPAGVIDQFAAVYLRDAGGDPYRALRLAVEDLIQLGIDSRLREIALPASVPADDRRPTSFDRLAEQ